MSNVDNLLALFLNAKVTYALGWTLVHSLWQSLIICTLLFSILKFTRNASANLRYMLSFLSLLCCVVMSSFTFAEYYNSIANIEAHSLSGTTEALLVYQSGIWTKIFTALNPYLDFIVVIWFVGVLWQFVRYLSDYSLSQKIKSRACRPITGSWKLRLEELASAIGVHNVQFRLSKIVTVPCVVGHFKPVVLLPLELISKLPSDYIEAIVLHELAHIRRNDYLLNVVLCCIKTLFFFNPFVMKICAWIDIERENACDDIAVEQCGDPVVFANSLSQFAALESRYQMAMAAHKRKYHLLTRVKRLFTNNTSMSAGVEKMVSAFCVLCLGITVSVNADSSMKNIDEMAKVNESPSTELSTAPEELATAESEPPATTKAKATKIKEAPMTLVASETTTSQLTDNTQSLTANVVIDKEVISSNEKPIAAKPENNSKEVEVVEVNQAAKTNNIVEVDSAIDYAENHKTLQLVQNKANKDLVVKVNEPKAPEDATNIVKPDADSKPVTENEPTQVVAQIKPEATLKTPEQTNDVNEQDDTLYRLSTKDFDHFIVTSLDKYQQFEGVKFNEVDLSNIRIKSNFSRWKKIIKRESNDSADRINRFIRNHNDRVSDIPDDKLLVANVSVEQVLHSYGYDSGFAATEEQSRFVVKSHSMAALVMIQLSDPNTEEVLGAVKSQFVLSAGSREFLGNPINTAKTLHQDRFWSSIASYLVNKIHSPISNIHESTVVAQQNPKQLAVTRFTRVAKAPPPEQEDCSWRHPKNSKNFWICEKET